MTFSDSDCVSNSEKDDGVMKDTDSPQARKFLQDYIFGEIHAKNSADFISQDALRNKRLMR